MFIACGLVFFCVDPWISPLVRKRKKKKTCLSFGICYGEDTVKGSVVKRTMSNFPTPTHYVSIRWFWFCLSRREDWVFVGLLYPQYRWYIRNLHPRAKWTVYSVDDTHAHASGLVPTCMTGYKQVCGMLGWEIFSFFVYIDKIFSYHSKKRKRKR